jgi:hypothetical protein
MADPAAPDAPPRRKRRGPSPTQRTLGLLRRNEWLMAVAERWVSQAKIRRDMYGWIDALGLPPPPATGVWGFQISMMSDHAARAAKMLSPAVLPNVLRWLQAGGQAAIVAWTKHQSKLRKTARWSATRFALRLTADGGVEWLPPELLSGPRRLTARAGRASRGRTSRAPFGTLRRSGARTSPGCSAANPADATAPSRRASRRGAPPAPWRALVGWPGGAS